MAAAVSSSTTSKTGVTLACSIVKDGFSGHSVSGGGGFDFDSDDDEHKARISSGLDDEEQNLWRGVLIGN